MFANTSAFSGRFPFDPQIRDPENGRKDDDGDRRSGPRAGEVQKGIGRKELKDFLGERLVLDLIKLPLDLFRPRKFRIALFDLNRLQIKAQGGGDADGRGNRRRADQNADDQPGDLAGIVGQFHFCKGHQNGDENQRDDDHLQQLHIPASHNIKPIDRGRQGIPIGCVSQLQGKSEHNPLSRGR